MEDVKHEINISHLLPYGYKPADLEKRGVGIFPSLKELVLNYIN